MSRSPVRVTVADKLGNSVDGAWWPHTPSIARELPELIDALRKSLGKVVSIDVNWSALDGTPDLDTQYRHGNVGLPGDDIRDPRVMTVTGDRARANLLVVPWRTSTALAVMVLRRAAALPILATHADTEAFRAADAIVRGACAQRAGRRARRAGIPR